MAIVVAVSCFTINVFAEDIKPGGFPRIELPFPCLDYIGVSDSSLKNEKWFTPDFIREKCQEHYDVDFSGYSLLYTVQQPSIPIYTVWFAKPLSNDSKLQLQKSGKDYYVVAKGDWDVYNVGFQFFQYPDSYYFSYHNVYHKWNGTINAEALGYCDFSIYGEDGEPIEDKFSASITTSSDGSELIGKITAGQNDLTCSLGVYDSSGVTVGINYITAGKCEANSFTSLTLNIVNIRTELEDMDIDFDTCIGKLTVTDSNGKSEEFTCSLEGKGEKEGLFSKKKEYLDYPDIEDYLTPMPEFPGFDIEHPWESLGNILKWIGECIWCVIENIAGLFRWLKDCFFITIKNIATALYNLVVDIRNMIEFLFIPDTKKMISQVSKSSPAMGELLSASELVKNLQGQVDNVMTFTFLGEQCTFRIANYVPENLASGMRSFSTVVILGGGFMSILNTFMSFLGMNGFARYVGDHVDISDR